MIERTGTERAFEALGDAIAKAEEARYIANQRAENLVKQNDALLAQVKALQEALLTAQKERDTALKAQRVAENRLEAVVEEYRHPTLKLELRGRKERGVPC